MLRICSLFVLAFLAAMPVSAADFSGVIQFSDADTLDVGDVRVRLFGIDAPETDQFCKRADGRPWACGKWATRQARRQFDRNTADCEKITIDQYGRTVARCFVAGQDIAETLTRQGVVQAYAKYSLDYIPAEKEASIADRGIWAGAIQDPAAFRAAKRSLAQQTNSQTAPKDCRIKGNISNSGRIFHVPGQKYYANTKISAARGERWFCSEAEAQAAGWRKSKT